MMLFVFLILFQMDFGVIEEDHAIYLSTTKVTLEKDGFDIKVSVFEDDLRDVLRNYTGSIVAPIDTLDFDLAIQSYFREMITIELPHEKLQLDLIEKEFTGTSYELYFHSDLSEHTVEGNIRVVMNFFYELFPTQQNVFRYSCTGVNEYHIFKKSNPTWTFSVSC